MTDTDEGEAEAEESTLAEVMEFTAEQVEREDDEFEDDMPNHAGVLINQRASELLNTLANIEVAEEMDDVRDPTEDEKRDALAEGAVDILLALGALAYEQDLDISSAYHERKELMEAIAEAETQEEMMAAILGDEDIDLEAMMGGGNVEVGDNVDADDYEHDDVDKPFR